MATRSAASARGTIDLVFILLALQSGMGLLAAIGELLLGLLSGAPLLLLWTLLFGFGVPLALAYCAFGLERGRRRAWQLVLAFEALLVVATALRWLLGMLPVSSPLALTTGAALPLLIAGLLLTTDVRQLFRRRASAAPAAGTGAVLIPIAAIRR